VDHSGGIRRLSDFPGRVVVLFFGFTQCSDVCPTTLSEMAEVKKKLGSEGDRL
jgi:protein SCO1/2